MWWCGVRSGWYIRVMIIIDGNNLLCAVQESAAGSDVIGDIGICRIIGRYVRAVGEKGQVVFDGGGPPDKSAFDNIEGVEVFFAGLGGDADGVIEDKIRADTSGARLTVVSSDRRLRKAARAKRAGAIKSDVFWLSVEKRLNREAPKKEPPAKREGLSESETERWLEMFGLDD